MEKTADFHYNSGQNYDEETILQQREIEKEIAGCQDLVGPQEELVVLDKEFENDAAFLKKIEEIKKRYKKFRRIRADGNCFFRAFGFAYFESLLRNPDEFKRFQEIASKSRDELINLGFPKFTLEDFHETFMEELNKIEKDKTIEGVLQTFNDSGTSDYLVVYLRLIVSGYLQRNEDFYQSFLDGGRTMKDFCNQEVEPMGRESDHIHIIALSQATGICVEVDYMDRGDGNLISHVFPEDSTPSIYLLYKPGHYDILYKE